MVHDVPARPLVRSTTRIPESAAVGDIYDIISTGEALVHQYAITRQRCIPRCQQRRRSRSRARPAPSVGMAPPRPDAIPAPAVSTTVRSGRQPMSWHVLSVGASTVLSIPLEFSNTPIRAVPQRVERSGRAALRQRRSQRRQGRHWQQAPGSDVALNGAISTGQKPLPALVPARSPGSAK